MVFIHSHSQVSSRAQQILKQKHSTHSSEHSSLAVFLSFSCPFSCLDLHSAVGPVVLADSQPKSFFRLAARRWCLDLISACSPSKLLQKLACARLKERPLMPLMPLMPARHLSRPSTHSQSSLSPSALCCTWHSFSLCSTRSLAENKP